MLQSILDRSSWGERNFNFIWFNFENNHLKRIINLEVFQSIVNLIWSVLRINRYILSCFKFIIFIQLYFYFESLMMIILLFQTLFDTFNSSSFRIDILLMRKCIIFLLDIWESFLFITQIYIYSSYKFFYLTLIDN